VFYVSCFFFNSGVLICVPCLNGLINVWRNVSSLPEPAAPVMLTLSVSMSVCVCLTQIMCVNSDSRRLQSQTVFRFYSRSAIKLSSR